ncbi:MAG: response regulator transcription factor [bacterium]|nr:response regulator transcription factor [bacterium]
MDEPGAAQRILVVDDDPDILRVVRYTLELEGFEVGSAGSAREALEWIRQNGLPHMAVVDIMMPGRNGIELCRDVQKFSDLPVIMLTAVDDEGTVVSTIDEVAEDYVTKPFRPRELAARVKRLIRRVGDFSYTLAPVTRIDDQLAIDFVNQRAVVGERDVSLTPTETKLLHILIRAGRRTVTIDYLLRRLWPLEEIFEDTLRVHVHRLRQKIEPKPGAPRYLITQRGVGYSFLSSGSAKSKDAS